MKATELAVVNFLQKPNVQFVIPVYQRNYDWSETECDQLFQDILNVRYENRPSHFIGSIVFIYDGVYQTSNIQELVIIDGQQRLTTLNLLYVALYYFAKKNNRGFDADRLLNMFLTNQYVQDDRYKVKLKQTGANAIAFDALLKGRTYTPFSKVINNYLHFKDKITSENFDQILEGLDRLMFVEISLERGKDDPQRIFESLNSTGLELSQSDLIRNYILMDLEPIRQREVFENIWSPIEENIKDIKTQNSLVSDFIRDYLTLRNKKIPNKNKVYQSFKQLHVDKRSESFDQELELIKSYSSHYQKFINPSIVSLEGIRKELQYLNKLEVNVAFPFLLQVFEDHENGLLSNETLIKVLQLIQSYAWRRFIAGYPTNALNKIFMTLYSEVDKDDYYESVAQALLRKKGSGKFPNDAEIRSALKDRDLYNIQAKNRSYLFARLENYNNNEVVDTQNERLTIEHIFPQTPTDGWKSLYSDEDFLLMTEKYLNTISNLTLSGNNGALSNRPFNDKKLMNVDGLEQGYKYSRLWLNRYLSEIENWDIITLETRFEVIFNRFLLVWPFPAVKIADNPGSNEEVNIFDAESPRFKKLEYFLFEDTKIEEDTVAQMYFYVIKRLFEINAQLLTENKGVLKISRDSHFFRSAVEVVSGWYVEANIDSDTKFTNLKKLLTLFDIEDELIIKYADNILEDRVATRHEVRKDYWQQLLPQITSTTLFSNVSPSKDHWITAGAGLTGLGFTLAVTKSCVRIELSINTSDKAQNKNTFNELLKNKSTIESEFGASLEWEELPEAKMSRIKYQLNDVSVFEKGDWALMNDFFLKYLSPFETVFKPYILILRGK